MLFQTLISTLPFLLLATSTPIKRSESYLLKSQKNGLCITPDAISAAYVSPSTPVIAASCEHALAWNFALGAGNLVLTGNPDYTLSAGDEPGNNGGLTVQKTDISSKGQA